MADFKTLNEAFVAAYAAMDDPTKNAVNKGFKDANNQPLKYADIGAMLDAVRPILTAHGIAIVQPPVSSDRGVGVRTILMGYGETLDFGEYYLPLGQQTAHGAGGAITYARRYALGSICGLAAEDDDGNAASGVTTPQRASVPKPAETAHDTENPGAHVVNFGAKAKEKYGADSMTLADLDKHPKDGHSYIVWLSERDAAKETTKAARAFLKAQEHIDESLPLPEAAMSAEELAALDSIPF